MQHVLWQMRLVLVLLGLSLGPAPARAQEEALVDFAAEEEAASASDRALQHKSPPSASDAPPASTADDNDDEMPVDFGAEEEAAAKADQELRGGSTEHRHGLAERPGPGAHNPVTQVKIAQTALADDPADSVDWSTQPFPEHEFSPWLVVGPGLGLLLMALHLRRRQ